MGLSRGKTLDAASFDAKHGDISNAACTISIHRSYRPFLTGGAAKFMTPCLVIHAAPII